MMDAPSPVPIFSLTQLQKGKCRDAFLHCLSTQGVFYLKDFGIPEPELTSAREVTMDFFKNGSEEAKMGTLNKIPGIRRGYTTLEAESTAQVTNTGDYSDYSMCFSMGIRDNVFPSPHFEGVWLRYFNQMRSVAQATAQEVLTAAADADAGDAHFDELLEGDPLLRFRYYPDVPEERVAEVEPLRMAPHYDVSLVSLIHQTPCPNGFISLQVQLGGNEEDGGAFVPLPPIPDTLIVLCGAVATIVCGGKVKAPIHRVVAPSQAQRVGSSRTSSVLFLRPKPDFKISVPFARSCGFNTILTGESATFQEWIGVNYSNLFTKNQSEL